MAIITDGHRYGKQFKNKRIDYIQYFSLTIKEVVVKKLLGYISHFPLPFSSHILNKKKHRLQ